MKLHITLLLAAVPALAVSGLAAGCRLEPLVDDDESVSPYILPADAEVPRVADDPELLHQILVHDGLDDGDLEEALGVVPRLTGWWNGQAISYWSFGNAPRIGCQLYVLVEGNGDRLLDHPFLLDSLPGDTGYSPIRRIQHVTVTDLYDGELLTTLRALTDAIELGLVTEPVSTGTWMDAPVVAPGTTLDVGATEPIAPIDVFADGYRAQMFVFGGELGVQPLRNGAIPVGQASLLLEAGELRAGDEPVMQWGPPDGPPTDGYNYTPLANRLEVRLAPGVIAADQVHGDADLFERSGSGGISAMTALVESFEVTEVVSNWPMQFSEGMP